MFYMQIIEHRLSNVNVEVGCNGQEGLVALACNPNYSAIITDFDMPVLDGVSFINQAYKDYHCHVPLMLHTSGNLPDQKLIDYPRLFMERKKQDLTYLVNFLELVIDG